MTKYDWDYDNQSEYDAVEKDPAVTTHTCSYGGVTYSSSVPGSNASGNNVGDKRVGWNGSSCYAERLAGYGAKFEDPINGTWKYSFNSSEIEEPIADKAKFVGVSLGTGNYSVDSAYNLSSYKDSYGCLSESENKYEGSVTYWENIYSDYTDRLVKLIAEVKPSNIFDWKVSTKAPIISATHRQETTSKPIINNYGLGSEPIDGTAATGSKIACNTANCGEISVITGIKDLYGEITGRKETVYGYSLPSNTNQYRLKPSGEPSNFIASNGMYYDLGFPNYFVANNALTTSGSGSITLNYSGLGQNNYFDKVCSGGTYGAYMCPYNTSENVETGCVGSKCDPNPRSFKYIYRTIDLDNPFPYTTGEDRQPGYNWRAFPNLVKEIITENRGVIGNALYTSDVTPMYSFDFTGANRSKLMKIRNYNKSNAFQYIKRDGITCTEGNECRSQFLRDELRDIMSGCGTNENNFNACSK